MQRLRETLASERSSENLPGIIVQRLKIFLLIWKNFNLRIMKRIAQKAGLESKLEKIEVDSRKLNDEIGRIFHELEVSRKHTGASVLNRCTSG